MRTVPEWVGKTDDAMPPPSVRLRLFLAADGRCQKCTRRIAAGEKFSLDHIIALCNGGENTSSNLQVLCPNCHGEKTKADVREKSIVSRKAKKHYGIKTKPRRPFPGSKASGLKKKISGEVVRRR